MKKPRLATRIRGALQLQPMTIRQLACCLSVTDQCAQEALAALTKRRIVRRHGFAKEVRQRVLFELVNCQPLNAREGI